MEKHDDHLWMRALTAAVICSVLIYYDRRRPADTALVASPGGARPNQFVDHLVRGAAAQLVEDSKPVLKEGLAQAEEVSRLWFKRANAWVDQLRLGA